MKNIKNITILKVSLICIVISYIANALYFMNLTILEPVFLKHYYESNIQRRYVVILHLITNSDDNREIVDIEFPQLPEDFAYVSLNHVWRNNNGYDRIEKFAHYDYRTIVLEFHNSDQENTQGDEQSVILDEAKIRYMNGDVQNVDIGKIVLHKNIKSYDFFDLASASSSNDYTSKLYVQSLKNIAINNIQSDLDNEIEGFLETTVNDIKTKDIQYPISFEAGDYISFNSKFLYDSNDIRKYNIYGIKRRIHITDSEGNKGYGLIYNLDYEPTNVFSTEKSIIDYLKYRGVK